MSLMSTTQDNVKAFTTKTGRSAVIRLPQPSDVAAMTEFINIFSPEDRFTRFAGEQVTVEEERAYLEAEWEKIAAGDAVKFFCFIDGRLAGMSDVHRDTALLTRRRHVGIFGIIIGKDFRGEGIGEMMMRTTIAEATKHIQGLRMIKLDCFATNTPAIALYKKLGFTEVGRIPEALLHKNDYVDEIIMIKKV